MSIYISFLGSNLFFLSFSVIVCAGQERLADLETPLKNANVPCHLIGGSHKAVELDAKFAIREGAELAAKI